MPAYILSPHAKAMVHMRNTVLPRMLQAARPAPAAPKPPAKKKKKPARKPSKSCSKAGRKLARCK